MFRATLLTKFQRGNNMVNSKNNGSHDSIQIWYEAHGQEDTTASLFIDINTWKIRDNSTRRIYIDFGLKIGTPKTVERMFLYIPWVLSSSDICDLGCKFKEYNILNGVFNERYTPLPDNGKKITVQSATKEELFEIYQLSVDNDIKIENKFGGSIISFRVNGLIKRSDLPIYFRIRVIYPKHKASSSEKGFFSEYRPRHPFFQSAMNITETTDFRVNENRNQDRDLIEEMNQKTMFNILGVRYFLILPSDDVVSGECNIYYQRQLERHGFWSLYLDTEKDYGEMSVFKCSKEEPLDHFRIFYKTQYRKSDWKTIVLFLILSISLATLFDATSAYIRQEAIPSIVKWFSTICIH